VREPRGRPRRHGVLSFEMESRKSSNVTRPVRRSRGAIRPRRRRRTRRSRGDRRGGRSRGSRTPLRNRGRARPAASLPEGHDRDRGSPARRLHGRGEELRRSRGRVLLGGVVPFEDPRSNAAKGASNAEPAPRAASSPRRRSRSFGEWRKGVPFCLETSSARATSQPVVPETTGPASKGGRPRGPRRPPAS